MNTNTLPQPSQTAVIYARVSSEEQVQGYSIQAQLRACREWTENHGYKVAKEYLEEGQSAFRNLEKREVLKELLADTVSKQRAFHAVIVHKLDRLFRDTLESSTARAILKRELLGSTGIGRGWVSNKSGKPTTPMTTSTPAPISRRRARVRACATASDA